MQEASSFIPASLWPVLSRFNAIGASSRGKTIGAASPAEYEFSPIAQVTLDRSGLIRRLNLAAARLLKATKSQILHVPFIAFVKKSHSRFSGPALDIGQSAEKGQEQN
jgi:hypothetical protein